MPLSSGNTTISRFMVSNPPHLYGSSFGQESSHSITSPFGAMHFPNFECQSEKSQSLNLLGGVNVLFSSNSFRTRLTAQILVNKISAIFSLNLLQVSANSCSKPSFCSSFSFDSSVSALMFEIVLANTSMCFVFSPVMTSISTLTLSTSRSYSCLLCAISAVKSSNPSRNLPHSMLIMSCNSPQFGSPSTHFFHCPLGLGSSLTGTVCATNCGCCVVVVVGSSCS